VSATGRNVDRPRPGGGTVRGCRKSILVAANLTWISAVLWVASFVLMIATFLHALGGLPANAPEELPAGVISVVGCTNRLMVLSAWCWVAVVAWHMFRFRGRARKVPQDTYPGSTARKGIVGA
jgi:hypothetical protein